MVEVIGSLVVPIMLSLIGGLCLESTGPRVPSGKVEFRENKSCWWPVCLSDRSYIYSFIVVQKKIIKNWWRDHTKLISSLTLLLYSPCFFADITFSIYYLYHMILDATHNYYSLSLILSYPKLVVFLLLIFGIDLYFMFIC